MYYVTAFRIWKQIHFIRWFCKSQNFHKVRKIVLTMFFLLPFNSDGDCLFDCFIMIANPNKKEFEGFPLSCIKFPFIYSRLTKMKRTTLPTNWKQLCLMTKKKTLRKWIFIKWVEDEIVFLKMFLIIITGSERL